MPDSTLYTSKLSSSRAVVIGGSSGIGLGVAAGLLEHGASVTIASSKAAKLDAARTHLLSLYPSASALISTHVSNLSDPTTIEANIIALFKAVGQVDHIVYTAGDANAQSLVMGLHKALAGEEDPVLAENAKWEAKGGMHAGRECQVGGERRDPCGYDRESAAAGSGALLRATALGQTRGAPPSFFHLLPPPRESRSLLVPLP